MPYAPAHLDFRPAADYGGEMEIAHLTPLMPCQSLEELSLQRGDDEANQLLSVWTALWHPALVAKARCMPQWASAQSPPPAPDGHLFLLPPCCEYLVPGTWFQEAEQAGSKILRGLYSRPAIVEAAIRQVAPPEVGIADDLVADFHALGFCHFTIEMLTQHLRYMSNLDTASFQRQLLRAADAAVAGDQEEAKSGLQAAFDLLHSAREYFYPVETHLLDLTLLAPTTLGAMLRNDLSAGLPRNFLVSARLIEAMAQKEPQSLEALRQAVEAGQAGIVGGELDEWELPLLPPEAIGQQIAQGLDVYQKHLGARPTVFGRRRFGLTPMLPQILARFGFSGVLHATLDEGRFPSGNQSRIRWEGADSTVVDALARIPAEVTRAGAFLRLSTQLGGSMDVDHVATAVFAHWPGRTSIWYDDLRRVMPYTSVLGKFATIDAYFQQTSMAGQQLQYKADEYRSPYLRQEVAAGKPNPISRWVDYYRRRAMAEAAATLETLAAMAGRPVKASPITAAAALRQVDASLGDASQPGNDDGQLPDVLGRTVGGFAAAIGSGPKGSNRGVLVTNSCSFARQSTLDISELTALPTVAGPVLAAATAQGRKTVTVEVPPLGYAWIGPGKDAEGPDSATVTARPAKKGFWGRFRREALPPPLVQRRTVESSVKGAAPREEIVLSNPHFHLAIDVRTGAIRAIHDYRTRGPRLAQQIAMRLPDARGEEDDAYSIMAADEVTITAEGPLLGEVVARGRLMARDGARLAGFQQTTRIEKNSRVIELLVELDVDRLPGDDPWNSYYTARFAWADDSATFARSANMVSVPTDLQHIEAPHFVEIRGEKCRTSILAGGLPYHRRWGLRKLDTLLAVKGETARRFRLGIGIDLPQPMQTALAFLAPAAVCHDMASPPCDSSWLFHLDARNVVATHWEALGEAGKPSGFRVRLLETEGRSTSLGLRSFRPVSAAKKIAAADSPPQNLAIAGDRLVVDLNPHEWTEVEAQF